MAKKRNIVTTCLNRLFLVLITIGSASCASFHQEKAMSLCNMENTERVSENNLKEALIKTQDWADKIYGESCITCAEIYSVENNSFTLHITSPEDLLINTSATIEFDRMTTAIIEKSIHHSCRMRYKN